MLRSRYSHAWGIGAITGVAGGLMGIEQTAPAFQAFTVKPRIGSLLTAHIKVPTLRCGVRCVLLGGRCD